MSDADNRQMNLFIRGNRPRPWTPTSPPYVPDAKPDADPPTDDAPPGFSSMNDYIRAASKRSTSTRKGGAAR